MTDDVGDRRDEIGLLAQDFDRMADELQRAWRRQTELTQNVSHELRSPLARLRVALELARRKSGELPEFDVIDRETGRLDELIGQILEFSKMDADAQEARSTIDVDELVASVVEDVRYEHPGDSRIEFEPGADATVDGYPAALRGGIENILRNAMQHAADGPVRVNITVDDTQVVVAIADQGGGVRDAELEQLFDPFYRAPSRSDEAGTGLGLAIAARAIAMNDGSVEAENCDGGLRVEIRLPSAG